MAVVFAEPGSDATFGTEFFTNVIGAVSSSTAQAFTGPRSLLCDSTGASAAAYVGRHGDLADAGRRISFRLRFNGSLPGGNSNIFMNLDAAVATVFSLVIQISSGLLIVIDDGGASASGTKVLVPDVWYRIAVSYTITAANNWALRIYVDGALDISTGNADFTLVRTGSFGAWWGLINAPGANKSVYLDDLYIDDTANTLDPGPIRVTARLPTTTTVNTFDTTTGTGVVNERPVNEANRKAHLNTTQGIQTYNAEALASGDVNLTAKAIRAQVGWVWAAKGAGTGTSEQLQTAAGVASIALTTTPALYRATVEQNFYLDSAAVGLRSTQGSADTFLYECGALVVFTDASLILQRRRSQRALLRR